jgi:type VI protein secretion system component VasK
MANRARGGGPSRGVATATAVVALIVLVVFIAILWGKADDPNNETAWARWTFLLAGIEAIAFAGAGFMFGREVNRASTEQVAQAQQDAQQNAAEAAEAKAGLEAVRDMATSSKESDGISDAAGLEAVIEVAEKRIAK